MKPTIKKVIKYANKEVHFIIKVPTSSCTGKMWLDEVKNYGPNILYKSLQPLIDRSTQGIEGKEFETLAALAFLFKYYSSLDNS